MAVSVKEVYCSSSTGMKAGCTYALPKIRSKEEKLVELKRNEASFRFCDRALTHINIELVTPMLRV